jgi:hypothetical protein
MNIEELEKFINKANRYVECSRAIGCDPSTVLDLLFVVRGLIPAAQEHLETMKGRALTRGVIRSTKRTGSACSIAIGEMKISDMKPEPPKPRNTRYDEICVVKNGVGITCQNNGRVEFFIDGELAAYCQIADRLADARKPID